MWRLSNLIDVPFILSHDTSNIFYVSNGCINTETSLLIVWDLVKQLGLTLWSYDRTASLKTSTSLGLSLSLHLDNILFYWASLYLSSVVCMQDIKTAGWLNDAYSQFNLNFFNEYSQPFDIWILICCLLVLVWHVLESLTSALPP